MAAVYVSNLIINAGATFSQTFNLEDTATNAPLSLTGYTASAQMRKWAGSSSSTSFTCTIESPATAGKLTISLTSTQTANLKPGRYVYDILITSGNIKNRVIEGMVLVTEGVTK
jgi:hypothetical protein